MTICTLTLSPALDIEYRIKAVSVGLNRTAGHVVSAGGKGINVSRAILGCAKKNGSPDGFTLRTAAPLGGPTGEMMKAILASEGIPVTAVPIGENTRVNVSLIPEQGEPLEINAPGTPIGDALERITDECLSDLGPGDVLVIAGSCPSDVPKAAPSDLVRWAKGRGITAVLDCDGEALRIAVNAPVKPDLIKPNNEEMAALAGCDPNDPKALAEAALAAGIPTVIVTCAGDGAILAENGHAAFYPTEKRPVVRLKGAGDTFLGAYVWSRYAMNEPAETAMKYAGRIAGNYVAGENAE